MQKLGGLTKEFSVEWAKRWIGEITFRKIVSGFSEYFVDEAGLQKLATVRHFSSHEPIKQETIVPCGKCLQVTTVLVLKGNQIFGKIILQKEMLKGFQAAWFWQGGRISEYPKSYWKPPEGIAHQNWREFPHPYPFSTQVNDWVREHRLSESSIQQKSLTSAKRKDFVSCRIAIYSRWDLLSPWDKSESLSCH